MANYNSFVFEGHGLSEVTGAFDPGAVGNGLKENDLADGIVSAARAYLAKTELSIHYDENNFLDKDLAGNTYSAKAGISVHINAGGGTGTEVFVPNREVHLSLDFDLVQEISSLLGIRNRGVKSRNYSTDATYLRTNGVAVNATDYYREIRDAWDRGISLAILEVGFIDNATDAAKMAENIDGIGWLVAKYIASLCGVELKKEVTLYKVQCGAFSVRNNAEALKVRLAGEGYRPFIVLVNGLYKVQVGAFGIRENAERLERELKDRGYNTYIVEVKQ